MCNRRGRHKVPSSPSTTSCTPGCPTSFASAVPSPATSTGARTWCRTPSSGRCRDGTASTRRTRRATSAGSWSTATSRSGGAFDTSASPTSPSTASPTTSSETRRSSRPRCWSTAPGFRGRTSPCRAAAERLAWTTRLPHRWSTAPRCSRSAVATSRPPIWTGPRPGRCSGRSTGRSGHCFRSMTAGCSCSPHGGRLRRSRIAPRRPAPGPAGAAHAHLHRG